MSKVCFSQKLIFYTRTSDKTPSDGGIGGGGVHFGGTLQLQVWLNYFVSQCVAKRSILHVAHVVPCSALSGIISTQKQPQMLIQTALMVLKSSL